MTQVSSSDICSAERQRSDLANVRKGARMAVCQGAFSVFDDSANIGGTDGLTWYWKMKS